jgi:hypothetical protein
MSAAILQGVPASTIDVDFWLDLPPRQYMRAANPAPRLGATMRVNTVFVPPGDRMVNFVYEVRGLKSFDHEYRRARVVSWHGLKLRVLPLDRIIKSKEFVRREKDIAHLPILRRVLKAERMIRLKPAAGRG